MPKGAETFGVSGSPGVEVFVIYDPARVTVPTGKTRWPLDANVDVTVSVDAASKALHDLKVSDPPLPAPSPQSEAASPNPHPSSTPPTYHPLTPPST